MIRPRTVKALGITVAALALWEAIVRLGLVNRIILAAPSDVVAGRSPRTAACSCVPLRPP